MNLQRSFGRRKARIEIIPLIDIIFFLLATFVMVSLSMVKNSGVPVRLPAASTAEAQERKNSVNVSVTEEGQIYWEKQRVTAAELKLQLGLLKAKDSDPRIFIYGDENTPLKNVLSVMDLIRGEGITKVAMQTRPAQESASRSRGEN